MRKINVKQTTGVALLVALIIVLQTLSMVLPKIGPGISISLVLIPIVLGGAVYGPKVGAILGGAFAAIVYIFCITGFDVGGAMVFQASPLLCLIRIIAPKSPSGSLSSYSIPFESALRVALISRSAI